MREKIEEIISNSTVSDLAWKYCDLNDEECGDYKKELVDKIISEVKSMLEGLKEKKWGCEHSVNENIDGCNACYNYNWDNGHFNKLIDDKIKELEG